MNKTLFRVVLQLECFQVIDFDCFIEGRECVHVVK